jgi:hypothetical protein
MSRFEAKPSPAYLAALKALRALPSGDRGSVYADAAHEELKEALLRGFTPSSGLVPHPLRLVGKRPMLLEQRPWLDHVAIWNQDGRPALFTSQPYGLSWEALCDLVDYCRQHGLRANVDASSWHFPGSTLLITVKAGREKAQA